MQLLLELQRTSSLTGKELGKAGDAQSNVLLLDLLAAERPDDAVLSEESVDSAARLSADRVWIIDPVDGTREYGMEGRTDWAVHVALWERGAAWFADHRRCGRATCAVGGLLDRRVSSATNVERETADLPDECQPSAGLGCRGRRGFRRGLATDGLGRRQGDGGASR